MVGEAAATATTPLALHRLNPQQEASVTTTVDYLELLDRVIEDTIAPSAESIDRQGAFPRAAVEALGAGGLLGLISAPEVGGLGQGHRAAATAVGRIAEHCASSAMVVCMHYAATAVIEAHGPLDVRGQIARGEVLASLAFSEAGSRSQFWAPMSTAKRSNGSVSLEAQKSWVTSAGEADYYVWSSRPAEAEGASTLWLVPAGAAGLTLAGGFDGLGLRGNASRPVNAEGLHLPASAMLGTDGNGFDVMLGVVLPYFQLMSAAVSIGIMKAAVARAAQHVMTTRFEHLDQAIGESPTVQAMVASMRIKTDMADALLADSLIALEAGRADATLRVLESKAAAADTALEVTDLAMRVCGGAAFRREVGVERHFRDARAASVMAPTSEALHGFIGKAVCGLPLF
jgi:alkylation response protein AidB-like acyl-CoA dehydrogenase